MALLDLIEDLKTAKRSDIKLDEALAIIAGYKRIMGQDQKVKWIAPGNEFSVPLPPFTKSMDAAYKLINILGGADVGGCSWEPGKATAKIGDGPYCVAANPALALCVASLTQKLQAEAGQ